MEKRNCLSVLTHLYRFLTLCIASRTFYIGQVTGWHITKGIGGCDQILVYQYKIGRVSQRLRKLSGLPDSATPMLCH